MHVFRLCLTLLTTLALGCSANRSTLSLRRDDGVKSTQHFDRAFAREEGGRYDIVLVAGEPGDDAPARVHGRRVPLKPSPGVPARQAVHLRVNFAPRFMKRAERMNSVNASIRWYVQPALSIEGGERLEYAGSALVRVDPKSRSVRITLLDADLTPARGPATASSSDPIGRSVLTGTIDCEINSAAVATLLAEWTSPRPTTELSGPPARQPVGP